MQRSLNLQGIVSFVALVLGGIATTSQASVIVLNGGYVGDGWVAPAASLQVMAYDLGSASSQTVQGVTFAPWALPSSPVTNASVTSVVNGNFAYSPAPNYSATSINGADTLGYNSALSSMNDTIFYGVDHGTVGPLTITVTGLTPNLSYVVDEFTYAVHDSVRNNETFKINGVTDVISGAMEPIATTPPYISYLIHNTVAADSLGHIVLDIISPNAATPVLSGFSIAYTPEPSSFVLLGLASGLLVWQGRRRVISRR